MTVFLSKYDEGWQHLAVQTYGNHAKVLFYHSTICHAETPGCSGRKTELTQNGSRELRVVRAGVYPRLHFQKAAAVRVANFKGMLEDAHSKLLQRHRPKGASVFQYLVNGVYLQPQHFKRNYT